MLQLVGTEGYGKKTESAGTAIQRLVGGRKGMFTHLLGVRYTAGATAHVLTVMRGQSYAKVAADAAAAQKDVVVDAALTDGAGNAIASGDIMAIQKPDGTWIFDTVASWAATTLTITMTTNLPTGGVSNGARVVSYGVPGDSGHSEYTFDLGASGTTTIPGGEVVGSVVRSSRDHEPLILSVNNVTNAGTLNDVQIGYSVTG